MTIHNDGVDIPIEIMVRQDLSFAEKMAYGVIKAYVVDPNGLLSNPTFLSDKLGITNQRAIYIMSNLKRIGLI